MKNIQIKDFRSNVRVRGISGDVGVNIGNEPYGFVKMLRTDFLNLLNFDDDRGAYWFSLLDTDRTTIFYSFMGFMLPDVSIPENCDVIVLRVVPHSLISTDPHTDYKIKAVEVVEVFDPEKSPKKQNTHSGNDTVGFQENLVNTESEIMNTQSNAQTTSTDRHKSDMNNNNTNAVEEKKQSVESQDVIEVEKATKTIPSFVNSLKKESRNKVLSGVSPEVALSDANEIACELASAKSRSSGTRNGIIKVIEYFLAKSMSEVFPFTRSQAKRIVDSAIASVDPKGKVSEYEAAIIIADSHRSTLAFNAKENAWYRYEARQSFIWSLEPEIYVSNLINTELASIKNNNFSSSFASGVKKILAQTLAVYDWDETPGLVAMNNGVLDLKTKTLRSANPSDRLTKKLSFDYDPNATCESLLDDLYEIADKSKPRYSLILVMLWMAVFGQSGLKAYFELFGKSGNNGKSTVINLLEALVGSENSLAAKTEDFTSQYGLADLRGKRLLQIPDAHQYLKSSDRLKSLTGGDKVRLEQKYQPSFEVVFNGLIIFATNKLIQFSDSGDALERRRIVIPFTREFKAEEQRPLLDKDNKNFSGEWLEQLPGLFNVLLEKYDRQRAKKVVDKYRTGNNPDIIAAKIETAKTNTVKEWALESLYYEKGAWLANKAHKFNYDGKNQIVQSLPYLEFRTWCEENGRKPKSSKDWIEDIQTLLNTFSMSNSRGKSGSYRYLANVRLKTTSEISLEDQLLGEKEQNQSIKQDNKPENPEQYAF